MHREIVFVSLRYWRQIFLYEKERRWKKNLKIVTEEIIERKLYVESDHLDTKHKPVADPIPQITCNCPKLSGNIIGTRRVSILQESVPLYPFWKLLPRRINRSSERKPQLIHKTQLVTVFFFSYTKSNNLSSSNDIPFDPMKINYRETESLLQLFLSKRKLMNLNLSQKSYPHRINFRILWIIRSLHFSFLDKFSPRVFVKKLIVSSQSN